MDHFFFFNTIDLCVARFGSVVNSILTPRIAKSFGVPQAVWAGTFACYVSFISAIILVMMMSSHVKKSDSFTPKKQSESVWDFKAMRTFPRSFWVICVICIMLYGTIVPFNNIASDFLMSKWYPNDTETAGLVMRLD